jgi:predicted nucleotidyltransferase
METIEEIKAKINPILKRYGVTKAAIFGSFARGEAEKTSDIDILVEVEPNMGLFEFIGLKHELEDKLKRKVDLVEYRAIKPRLKNFIFKDQLAIL